MFICTNLEEITMIFREKRGKKKMSRVSIGKNREKKTISVYYVRVILQTFINQSARFYQRTGHTVQYCARWLNCTVCPTLQLLCIARNVAGVEASSTSATFHATIALCVSASCNITRNDAT